MNFNKFAMLILLACVVTGSANAGFVDKRSAPGISEVEAIYRNAAVKDVAETIIPSSYAVLYETPDVMAMKTSVSGKGAWDTLLAQALTPVGLVAEVDGAGRKVTIKRIVSAVPATGASTEKKSDSPVVVWKFRKGDEISEVISGWAKETNKWQFAWESEKLFAGSDFELATTFEDVVEQVIRALNKNGAGLRVKFYSYNSSNHILRIWEKK